MKRLAVPVFVLCAVLLAGCGGGGNGPAPWPSSEELACQLQEAGWELWVIQTGDDAATPLTSRVGANALKPNVNTWFLARILPSDGKPAFLLDFRCLPPSQAGDFCLKGQIDQEEPTTDGTFTFRYEGAAYPVQLAECARWMTTRGIRLCICDVEVCLDDPYSFYTR